MTVVFSNTISSPPINLTQSGASSGKAEQQFIFQEVNEGVDIVEEHTRPDPGSSKQARSVRPKEILTDENGVDALQASDEDFNQKILLIKKQLEQKDHPINELLEHFNKVFYAQYNKEVERGMKGQSPATEEQMKKIIGEVQTWVRLAFFSVLRFYRLNLQGMQFGDVRKDLLLNMITSIVMKDYTYSIIMNTILQAQNDRVKQIQRNMSKYKYKLSLEKLGVSKYFQLSTAFREEVASGRNEAKKNG